MPRPASPDAWDYCGTLNPEVGMTLARHGHVSIYRAMEYIAEHSLMGIYSAFQPGRRIWSAAIFDELQ